MLKKKNIKPEGFIVTNDKIYVSLNNGRLVEVDVISGKSVKIVKIDNEKISRPYVLNKKMYILKDKAILKLN